MEKIKYAGKNRLFVRGEHRTQNTGEILNSPVLTTFLVNRSYFSRDVKNLSPNLSPCRREALIFPPSLVGKGARGLGFSWIFPHGVKSQVNK
ncbi:hypothetical protein SD81_008890 [Tolypothrix campylonemoides VB511288]|nr:hypothetical protein SD81_008890 [Tolypothrix campylonemoides VB511288]